MNARIIYLHGFNSSNQSAKALILGDFLREQQPQIDYQVPLLPSDPQAAIDVVEQLIASSDLPTGLVGSSLGGFYATVIAERHQLPAVLVNPVVGPHRLLAGFRGPQVNPYTGEHYEVTDAHVATLHELMPAAPWLGRYWLLLGSADEILDYREALAWYGPSPAEIEQGDDHALRRFPRHLAALVDFLFPSV